MDVDTMGMAEPTAAETAIERSADDYRQRLAEAVSRPEPMCLVLVGADIPASVATLAGTSPAEGELLTELERRLRRTLRGYDILAPVDATTFMVVIRTLAEAVDLDHRISTLFRDLSRPYRVGGTDLWVAVSLGAVVREPSERPEQLLSRAEDAMVRARAGGSAGPVLV